MKNNKKTKVIKVISIILAIILIFTGIWFATINITSSAVGYVVLDQSKAPQKSEFEQLEQDIDVNGVTIHYSVCGQGNPLLLIHGNGGSHHDFDDLIGYLSNDYTVYAMDSRCQGESTGNEISYELMAQDTATFIEVLGLEKPIVFGHSDGGIVGLLVAIEYPDLISGLISGGANSVPEGLKWYSLLETKIAYCIKKDDLNKMMVNEPNITIEMLNKITVPTYIVAGEFDIIKLSDTKFIAENISGSDIAIVKNASHSSYTENGKQGYVLIKSWIDDKLS
jgi:pimeloyl-ACP methyl ester carboxylesterase